MAIICIVDSPEIGAVLDKAQKWFPNKTREELKTILGLYFEYKGWIPDMGAFIHDLEDNNENRTLMGALVHKAPSNKGQWMSFMRIAKRLSREKENLSMDAYILMNRRAQLRKSFTAAQRVSRVDMIARNVSDQISRNKPENVDRDEYIRRSGGIRGVLMQVKARYQAKTNKQWWMDMYVANYRRKHEGQDPNIDDMQANERRAEVMSENFRKVVDNFDALAMEAMEKISKLERIRVDYYGTSLDESAEELEKRTAEEMDYESDGDTPKGEQYNIDYRTLNTQDTLSSVAERVLMNVRLLDDDGRQLYDDLNYVRYADPLRVHGLLNEIVEQANSSEDMMRLLEDMEDNTPWMSDLVRILKEDDAARTAIYDNYKRTITRYEDVYRKGDENPLQVAQQNSMSARNAALRTLTSTMLSGLVLQRLTSVYDGNTELVSDEEHVKMIDELFAKLEVYMNGDKKNGKKGAVKGTNSTDPDKIARREQWLKDFPDAIDDMVAAVRSFGFEIGRKQIERLVTLTKMSDMDKKRLNQSGGEYSVLNSLVKLHKAYKKSLADHDTPEDFIGKNGKELRELSSKLGVVSFDDVDSRALIDGKSYMTYTTPNLAHQIADEFVGRGQGVLFTEEQDRKGNRGQYLDFDDYLWDRFGKYEGFHLSMTAEETENEKADPSLRLRGKNRMLGWLAETSLRADEKGLFQVIDVMDIQTGTKKEYKDWTPVDHFKVGYAFFRRQSGTRQAAFEFPPMSDYNVCNVITAPTYDAEIMTEGPTGELEYDTNNQLVALFADEVKAEMQRMDRIAKSKAMGENGRIVLSTLEEQGMRFHVFPGMNDDNTKQEYDRLIGTPGGGAEADYFLKKRIAEYLNKYVQDELKWFADNELFKEEEFKPWLDKEGKITKKGMQNFRAFILNDLYAQRQITKIFFGGPEFYADSDEYHKRSMFVHAPRTVVDVTAKWHGEDVLPVEAHGSYKMAIVDDLKLSSAYKAEFERIYTEAVAAGLITEAQKKEFMEAWDGIKVTDGQAFRSLDSFVQVCKMADKGLWTERHDAAYQALESGNATPEAVATIQSLTVAQNLKSVVTGYEEVDTKLKQDDGTPILVRSPYIHKHSEAVMLAPYLAPALRKLNPQFQSPLLRGLGNFMKNNGIDVIEFKSCVKMGAFGVIKSSSIADLGAIADSMPDEFAKTVEQELKKMYDTVPGAKHEIPYKYFGIASSTPVDYANTTRAFSSQAVKMQWNDIFPEDVLTIEDVDGQEKTMNSLDAKRLFYKIYARNIQDAWEELVENFKDPKVIEELLQSELASKSYNSPELRYALSLIKDNNGNLDFTVPLASPATSRAVQQLLTSIIRNRVAKERTKGGNLIQQTSFGFDDYTDVVYGKEAPKGWDPVKMKFSEPGKLSHVEVYMPIHDDRLLQYADETGAISPDRLQQLVDEGAIDENMLKFVAYRTPTDGIHAVIPCKIKGFLPRSSGGAIIMPREVMVLTGNDFDADKMLCHFKDFIMREYDEDKIWALYNKAKESNESYDNLFKALFGDEFKPGSIPSFRSFRNNILNQEDYIRDNNLRFDKPHVISIQYDYGSDPENQSREARNNAEIDLMFANITSKKGTMRFLIPGGFEPISRMAYATKILKSRDPKVQEKLNNIMTTGGFTTRKELRDYMLATPSENLRKFLAQHAAKESALSLHSRYASAREIMAGRDTISRYALYNSGLAMLQNSGIGIQAYFKEVHGQDGTAIRDANGEKIYEELMPVIFGYTLDRLDEIMDKEGRLKSGVLAQLISAAVDNRNKPILSLLNQNEATIGLTLAFIASGLPRESVFTLVNQPIVEKLAVMKAKNPFADISTLINSLIDDIQLKLSSKYTPAERLSKFPQGFPTAITRMQNRSEADFIEHLGEDPNKTDEEFIKDQLAVLYMLRHMAGVSEDLNTLIMCLRPENAKNGCGPLIASVVSNRKRIEDMRDRIENGECKITFEYPLLITYTPDIDDPGSAIDQAYALNDVLPMTSMMNSMQLYGSTRLLSPYMVMATENWMGALAQTLDMYDIKRPKDALAQQAFNEMMTFKLLKDPALVSDDMPAQRQDIVVELPKRLMALKGRLTDVRKLLGNPKTTGSVTANERALAENKFLMKLFSVIPKDADKIPRIQLRLGGVLTQKITQQLRDGWDELMYMKGSVTVKDSDQKSYELDINKFAIELFKYNMYTDGFGFGQYTISQMAPPSVQLYCPGWISALKKLSDPAYGDFTPEEYERFRVQYIMNHWYDRRLVHRVEDDVWKKVFKEEKDGKVLLVPHVAESKEAIDAGDRNIDPITLFGTSNFLAHRDANGKITLYRVVGIDTKSGEIALEAYPKVGSYDSFSQVGVQYEPLNPDPKSITPVHTGVDSSWGNFSWTQKDELNVFNLNNIDAENPSDNESKPMTEEQRKAYLISKALGRYLPQSSNVASEASSAAPRSAIDDLQNLLNSRLGIRVVQPESPENTSAQTEAAIQANESPQTEITTPEEGTPQQNPMAKALQDMLNSKLGGRSFMLVRHSIDENGRPVVQTEEHRGTPAVINEARDMKVNYEVNKVLRKILADVGVGVGVLYDFEARLGAAGVTDFSQANVVAEGLLELIRIAEGEEGEAALPEEFSHLAIAMLGPNDSLVNRLRDTMSMEVVRDILGEFFEEYNTLYNGNLRRLQFEAMGQLVARHLINGEPIQPKPYRNLLQRIIDKIKDILRRIGIRNLQYELAKANEAASYIAEGFLNGNLADLLRKENITESDKYYGFNKISKAIEDNGDALNKILQRDVKRYHMLKERTKRSKQSTRSSYLDTATSFIEEIEKAKTAVDKTKQNLAINTYLKSAIAFIGKCNDGINSAISSGMDANRVCGRLRIDRDMIYSFQDTLKDLRTFSRQNPGVLTTETSGLLNSCQTLLTAFYEHYHEVAMTYFTEFVKTYMGEEMTIGIGKHKGEKITADNVVLGADKDISFINRWLDSMADQPDMLNKIFDIAVKEYKSKVRLHDIEVRQKIDVAFSRFLKETGSRDQSFMFERKDGKRTGDYISEKECISRYGTNSAQYRFYKAMMDIKKECDTWFPTGVTSELNTIKIHKDLLDRMKSSASVTDALNNVWRAMQDKLFVRSSDEEYQAARAIVDFEGNKFDLVPIYYMHLGQGEREEDMSEDVASTMLAYSHMAMNYKELSGIINILENARSMAQERRITIRRGGKPEQESINAAGYLVPRTHTKAQKETMIGQMLDDFFSMQVYGHMRADQGTFGNTNISQQKAADVVNEATTFSQMALNLPQRFSNVNTGVVQIAEEAIANEEFSPKTLSKANIWYSEHLPEFWSKVGMDTNDSELALIDEMFDITQENQRRFKDREYRKNAVEKNADKGLLTLGLTAGEHYLSMTTGASIMLEYEMRDDKGNKTDLLHSLERIYLDPVNKTGAKMAIKKGYTKPDGTEFNADDIFKMTNKIAAVNFRLQGIYNTQDKNMILQYNYGVLIMMFRKWMIPNLRRRYGGSNYNFMTEKWGEGFYRTLINLLPSTIEEFRHFRTTVTTNWQNMTPTEKANVRRAVTEIGTWIGIQLSLMLLGRVHVDDDKENKDFDDWLFEMTYYQLLRLKTEIGAQLPWPPSMIREGKKILAEPFAGMKTLENTFALVNLLDPRSYTTRMQSGPYKGRTKAYTYLMKAPYINIGRTIGRAFDQSDLIEYYKQ